jgi:translation elongation factor EF-4
MIKLSPYEMWLHTKLRQMTALLCQVSEHIDMGTSTLSDDIIENIQKQVSRSTKMPWHQNEI